MTITEKTPALTWAKIQCSLGQNRERKWKMTCWKQSETKPAGPGRAGRLNTGKEKDQGGLTGLAAGEMAGPENRDRRVSTANSALDLSPRC